MRIDEMALNNDNRLTYIAKKNYSEITTQRQRINYYSSNIHSLRKAATHHTQALRHSPYNRIKVTRKRRTQKEHDRLEYIFCTE